MPNVDVNAPIVTHWYCPACGEPTHGAATHDCPGVPCITVYPGGVPQAAWVRPVGDPVPPGAHLVHTIWVGRMPIGVYVKNVRDDREDGHENTTVRSYH